MSRRFWKTLLRQITGRKIIAKKRSPAFRPALEQLETLALPSSTQIVPTYVITATHLAKPQSGPGSGALSPTQIRNAYGINSITFGSTVGNGSGETIAIVDAYDDPSISTDLATFDSYYGIAAPPSFTKVGISKSDVASTTSFPPANSGWAGEIELDVEWSHAVAP
jgi:subtilase family serine protease